MARTGVTYFDIVQAAEAVKGRGDEPTVDRVRAELGTGSKSTIAPLLKRWRSESGNPTADTGGLPQDLVDALKALQERIQEEADRKVTQATQEHEAAFAKWQDELASTRDMVAERTASLRDLEQKLQASVEENRQLKASGEEARTALAKSEFQREQGTDRIAELKSALDELKQENRDIRDHFEHFQRRTADDRQQERDQFRSTNEQLRSQVTGLSDQLAAANRRLAEREALGEQLQTRVLALETERQEALQQFTARQAEIESLQHNQSIQQEQLTLKASEIDSLREQVTSLSGHNASVAKEAELLRDSLHKIEKELETTGEKLASMTDENRQILQEKAVLQGQFKQLERSFDNVRLD